MRILRNRNSLASMLRAEGLWDLDQLLEKENSLKNAIQDLGLVNLAALQDYEAVKERVFFCKTSMMIWSRLKKHCMRQ